ncbi:hypothetical protein Taro_023925 [Colocasia esculenta]|uniref:Uncharacterized protein n=1 Tax=Colocasia esculenta TaxID=4460 RepID=A0A843V615_COLES|nr:hypothetical protein [Colocasia esculenta]
MADGACGCAVRQGLLGGAPGKLAVMALYCCGGGVAGLAEAVPKSYAKQMAWLRWAAMELVQAEVAILVR